VDTYFHGYACRHPSLYVRYIYLCRLYKCNPCLFLHESTSGNYLYSYVIEYFFT